MGQTPVITLQPGPNGPTIYNFVRRKRAGHSGNADHDLASSDRRRLE